MSNLSPLQLSSSSSNHNKPNALQKMNPMIWRQARTVKKAVEMVDDYVLEMTKGAPFLETVSASPNPHLALLDRPEIQTGKLLGEGSFCQVYEVTGIHLQHNPYNNNTHDKNNNNHNAPSDNKPDASQVPSAALTTTTPLQQQEAARQTLQAAIKEDRDARLPSRYAIKQPKRELLRRPHEFGKAIADLVVEALYLSRLDHPNILKLHAITKGGTAAFEQSGHKRFDAYFLLTDRLTDTLDQRIEQWQRQGPPDASRIPRKTNYALQVANALLYLHKRRIIFRDLKPENIGFRDEHTVQLFDFGLCRELPQGFDNERYAMSGSGSQWYMSVEIFLTGKYNLKADVYSWAISTYEMLTETKPFAKMNKLQHVAMVCVQGKRPRLSQHDLPPRLEAIIRRAWGQSVSKRPSIQEVARALEQLLPELGDEEACVWPTVEYNPSEQQQLQQQDQDQDQEVNINNINNPGKLRPGEYSDDEISLEAFLMGSDGVIDDEIRKEVKKDATKPITYGDVDDDNDYSLSSLVYGDH